MDQKGAACLVGTGPVAREPGCNRVRQKQIRTCLGRASRQASLFLLRSATCSVTSIRRARRALCEPRQDRLLPQFRSERVRGGLCSRDPGGSCQGARRELQRSIRW
ncbi:hypothetical protein D3C85_1600730 [compost metagenome]